MAILRKTLVRKIEQLDAKLAVDPDNKEDRREKAFTHAQCGEFDAAISQYSETL
jgi:hypothetical protein